MNTITRVIKGANSNSNVIWLVIIVLSAAITGVAIADKKWVYFGVLLSPLIIYLCIHKPFIFPFGAYAFLLPFDSLLSVMGTSQGATLTKLMGVLTILVFSLKGAFENKLKKPDAASIWWILFVMYGILSVWWAIKSEFVLSRIPTAVGLLLLYLVASSYQIKKREYETLKWFILVGGFLAAIFTIYTYTTGFSYAPGVQRSTLDIGGRTANPNLIAFSLLIPVTVSITMMLNERKNIMKSLLGIVFAIILFGIIITGSRGCMLGVAAIFIVYILSIKQGITHWTIFIIIGTVVILFASDIFLERWKGTLEDRGAGRLEIWYVGWKSLEKYWLIGAGLNNFIVVFDEFAHYAPSKGKGYACHNLYLGMFVTLGIIGITLIGLAIRKHYKAINSRFTHYNYDAIMLKASFWGVLLSCMFGDYAWNKSFWLLWIMIIMYKNISEDKLKEQRSYNHRS